MSAIPEQTKPPTPVESPRMQEIFERISGDDIYGQLAALSQIGGRKLAPFPDMTDRPHFAPSRLALSEQDIFGREFMKERMEEAGLNIDDSHPLGIMGKLEGTNPDAKPIVLMSHHDTVPQADMFDGVTGVLSAIAVTKAINESGTLHKNPIWVLSLTGEESARFKRALFGSGAFFHGLGDATLESTDADGITLRQAITGAGGDINRVNHPFFTPDEIDSVIELHVDQTGQLHTQQRDIGLVEAIAAPQRFEITIGQKLEPDAEIYPYSEYIQIDINGVAGHSGATPMHLRYRADALPPLGDILDNLYKITSHHNNNGSHISLSVGHISIENQALNKIPGHTQALIRINGTDAQTVSRVVSDLQEYAKEMTDDWRSAYPAFPPSPFSISAHGAQPPKDAPITFYDPNLSFATHLAASGLILDIQHIAEKYKDHNVVATVGTYDIHNGQVVLGLDVRGIDDFRNQALKEIVYIIDEFQSPSIPFEHRLLDGSGDPVSMDPELVQMATCVIQEYTIGSVVQTQSPAGHDAMNAATAGIPTLLIFIPSKNGAHNPNAYTSPAEIEKGARALAAITLARAN